MVVAIQRELGIPIKLVPASKRGEIAFGLVLVLSVVGFLFWMTIKFLKADSDRTENDDGGPPPPVA